MLFRSIKMKKKDIILIAAVLAISLISFAAIKMTQKDGKEALQILNKDEAWLKNELKKKHISHIEDVLYCVLEKKDLYVIKK